jgi:magnesium chelatase subunit I
MPISAIEILCSNLERRAITTGDREVYPRLADLAMVLPAITGKVEMVYEGEQQGSEVVARKLVGDAVTKLFEKTFPPVERAGRGMSAERDRDRRGYGEIDPDMRDDAGARRRKKQGTEAPEPQQGKSDPDYEAIVAWFMSGNRITVSDEQPFDDYFRELQRVPKLADVARRHAKPSSEPELAFAMEMILEALHQGLRLSREDLDSTITFTELMKFNILRTIR